MNFKSSNDNNEHNEAARFTPLEQNAASAVNGLDKLDFKNNLVKYPSQNNKQSAPLRFSDGKGKRKGRGQMEVPYMWDEIERSSRPAEFNPQIFEESLRLKQAREIDRAYEARVKSER